MEKVIGMDLGDKSNLAVVFDEEGKEVEVRKLANTSQQVQRFFAKHAGAAVVIEAGTHSPWVSRLLESMGHKVCIGNPRKLRVIWDSDDKSDERDARILGLMYRLEPRLLHQIFHRGEEAQADLETIKARDKLVASRTKLVNHIRGAVKGLGCRVPCCDAMSFSKRAPEHIPVMLWDALAPMIEAIEQISLSIKQLDKRIEQLCRDRYPETKYLLQVPGVGPITALAFVLTLEDAGRFEKSRAVGAYLGLAPGKEQSGQTDKQKHITKAGNKLLRRLLLGCANYILGAFGSDCDLRRYGDKIAARGGKNAKRRAKVAVARKLAVRLHRVWATNTEYRLFVGQAA